MTKEQLDYLSSRSPVTPDYLPYSYQRTAPYLLWDELSSQHHLSGHSASSSSSSSLCSCCCCRTAVIVVAILLICGLFTLIGVAIYLGIITNNLEEFTIEEETYEGRMRVMTGDRYSLGLSDRTSPEFIIKAQTYETLLNTIYQKSVLNDAYIKSQVRRFKNGSLVVYFRLHLDRRKLPSEPVKLLYEILYKEVTSPQPVSFKNVQIEPQTLNISGIVADFSDTELTQKYKEYELPENVSEYVMDVDYTDGKFLKSEYSTTNTKSEMTETNPLNINESTEITSSSMTNRQHSDFEVKAEELPRFNYTFVQITNRSETKDVPNKATPSFNDSFSVQTKLSSNSTSWKPISGTASEVNFDWETEDGVSALFHDKMEGGEELLYAEPDNSNEFGIRIKPPPESTHYSRVSEAQDRSDFIPHLHAESPALVINRHNSKVDPVISQNRGHSTQLINPRLKSHNTTSKTSSSSPWRPITPLWHRHSQESRELFENANDERVGFGLRLKPNIRRETVLHNQSSQAFIVRLPPRTRKPLSINDDNAESESGKWKPYRQTRMRNSDEEEDMEEDSTTKTPELEGRVIPNSKLDHNNIFYSTKTENKEAKLNEINNEAAYGGFGSEEISDKISNGNSWVTSVSVESSTSIVLGDKSDINVSTYNNNIPSTLIITSIVTSVEEVSGETTSQPLGTKVSSAANSTVETYSIKQYFFNLFPELLKLSDAFFQSSLNETSTNQSTKETKTIMTTTVIATTNKAADNIHEQNLFNSTDNNWLRNTTKIIDGMMRTTPAQKFNLLDLLEVENITQKSHFQSGTQFSPMHLIHPEENDDGGEISSKESYEESNFLISTNVQHDQDQDSNLKLTSPPTIAHDVLTFKTTAATLKSSTIHHVPPSTTIEPKGCNSPTLFHCQSGECVSIFSRCNRMRDCFDNSDEDGCSCADFIRSNVINSTLCDGIIDCWDFSDENQCDWCSPSMFVCANARVCIAKNKVCDGFADCPGGEDERACVTVAPNMTSANSGNYWGKGLVMIRREGRWGKLCMENFENFVSETQVATGDLGRVLCRTMGYEDFEEAKQLKDFLREARDNETFYYEPQYHENETNSRSSSIHFVSTPCHSKEVVRVMCKNFGCGKRHQSSQLRGRIVGGSNSTPGSWPWQAAVYKEGNFMCGATLISERWLLSAAHCFYQAVDHYWTVRLGILRRGSFSPYERVHRLSHIILHPNYLSFNFINDISLLRLANPVAFSDYIRPICLPNPESTKRIIDRKQLCTVVGWGQTDEHEDYLPDILQEVKLPLISAEECRETSLITYTRVNSKMFCAGMDRGGRDSCLGDSGGPMMCQESEGRWALTGITSNGFGCARASRPGIYTNVASYLKWIKKMTEQSHSRSIRSRCNGHRCLLGKCLSKRQVCDGFVDCMEGSDEKDCHWPERRQA